MGGLTHALTMDHGGLSIKTHSYQITGNMYRYFMKGLMLVLGSVCCLEGLVKGKAGRYKFYLYNE